MTRQAPKLVARRSSSCGNVASGDTHAPQFLAKGSSRENVADDKSLAGRAIPFLIQDSSSFSSSRSSSFDRSFRTAVWRQRAWLSGRRENNNSELQKHTCTNSRAGTRTHSHTQAVTQFTHSRWLSYIPQLAVSVGDAMFIPRGEQRRWRQGHISHPLTEKADACPSYRLDIEILARGNPRGRNSTLCHALQIWQNRASR